MAGTKEEQPPAPSTTIKKVERWECGAAGHAHNTENEAKTCSDFEIAVTDITKSLQLLQPLVKGGRAIRPESAALLRSIVDELVPPAPKEPTKTGDKEEETTDPALSVHDDGPETIEVSEEAIRAAVAEAVTEELGKMTGRVD